MRLLAVVGIGLGLLISGPVSAHHGGTAYESGKTVTLKGTVKEWLYSNHTVC